MLALVSAMNLSHLVETNATAADLAEILEEVARVYLSNFETFSDMHPIDDDKLLKIGNCRIGYVFYRRCNQTKTK